MQGRWKKYLQFIFRHWLALLFWAYVFNLSSPKPNHSNVRAQHTHATHTHIHTHTSYFKSTAQNCKSISSLVQADLPSRSLHFSNGKLALLSVFVLRDGIQQSGILGLNPISTCASQIWKHRSCAGVTHQLWVFSFLALIWHREVSYAQFFNFLTYKVRMLG